MSVTRNTTKSGWMHPVHRKTTSNQPPTIYNECRRFPSTPVNSSTLNQPMDNQRIPVFTEISDIPTYKCPSTKQPTNKERPLPQRFTLRRDIQLEEPSSPMRYLLDQTFCNAFSPGRTHPFHVQHIDTC